MYGTVDICPVPFYHHYKPEGPECYDSEEGMASTNEERDEDHDNNSYNYKDSMEHEHPPPIIVLRPYGQHIRQLAITLPHPAARTIALSTHQIQDLSIKSGYLKNDFWTL